MDNKPVTAEKARRRLNSDTVYYIVNTAILVLLTLIVVYPLYFLVIASISDPDLVLNGEVLFYPREITFSGFERLFQDNKIWNGYLNTIINTVASTAISLAITVAAGYGLSRPNMIFKKFFLWLFIITMFFGGGLIPFYLVVSQLGWINTRWALIVPSALNVWNVFMTKAYFESNIPDSILEAARIDGANEFMTFVRIVLPISQAIIAVMLLFYAVGNWNSYFNALIFITTKQELFPLQWYCARSSSSKTRVRSAAAAAIRSSNRSNLRIRSNIRRSSSLRSPYSACIRSCRNIFRRAS